MRLKQIFLIAILGFLFSFPFLSSAEDSQEEAIISSLEFLRKIPEVDWVKINKHDVIIGWKGIPRLFVGLNRRAAVSASDAIGSPVHVWAVRHNQRNWKKGTKSYICQTLASNGKIRKSTCVK